MPEPNGCEPEEVSPPQKNEIVVYQPDETLRLDVRLENETVWLTQSQMGTLFGCTTRNVRLHLENIYACGELTPEATRKDFFLVRQEGVRQVRRMVTCYNLDAIISVGYRVNSVLGVRFRQWATTVLKEYLLRGYSVDDRDLYLIGASLKDLGKKCFGFTKMDSAEIPGLKARL